MITFNDKIELDDDVALWYIDYAEEEIENVYELFQIVLTNYYLRRTEDET